MPRQFIRLYSFLLLDYGKRFPRCGQKLPVSALGAFLRLGRILVNTCQVDGLPAIALDMDIRDTPAVTLHA